MPELPEVETVRRILEPIVQGKRIKNIDVFYDGCFKTDVDEFKISLIGETFDSVSRIGKFLIFHLSNEKVIISHLRMEGKYYEGYEEDLPDKHDIMRYVFEDGTTLRYNDVRKFGIIQLSFEDEYRGLDCIAKLGPEPWETNESVLYNDLQERGGTIKEALLDQTIMTGLGNIYVDETLYATGIRPTRYPKSITKHECSLIVREARRILDMAIENGGSTIKSYHPKEGVTGLMQVNLKAYGHAYEPCSKCGYKMKKIFIGGRGTTYCPMCQRDESRPFIVGVTGPIASGKSTASKYIASKGYVLIDADLIVAELYKKLSVQRDIKMLLRIRKFDRKLISQAINEDPKKKKRLEDYVHPLVYREIYSRINKRGVKKVVLDVPLLFGSPLEDICDMIITVLAVPDIQKERIIERGKDPEVAMKLNAKWPLKTAEKKSNYIFHSNVDVEYMYANIDGLDL